MKLCNETVTRKLDVSTINTLADGRTGDARDAFMATLVHVKFYERQVFLADTWLRVIRPGASSQAA
jgi:hypothetical protein